MPFIWYTTSMTFTVIYLLSVKKKKGEKGHVQMVIYHMVINVLNVTLNLKFSLGYSYNYCVTLINIHKKNI